MQERLLMIELMEEPTHSKTDSGESESEDEEFGNAKDLMAITVHALASY
jgi:hypothetical protein